MTMLNIWHISIHYRTWYLWRYWLRCSGKNILQNAWNMWLYSELIVYELKIKLVASWVSTGVQKVKVSTPIYSVPGTQNFSYYIFISVPN